MLKKGKIGIFAKGIVHDVGQKVEVFSSFLKKPLKTIKTTVYEKRKITIFPKGLVRRFRQKFEICSTLIFLQNRPRKSIWERSS